MYGKIDKRNPRTFEVHFPKSDTYACFSYDTDKVEVVDSDEVPLTSTRGELGPSP